MIKVWATFTSIGGNICSHFLHFFFSFTRNRGTQHNGSQILFYQSSCGCCLVQKKSHFSFQKLISQKKKVYFLAFCVVATYINMGQKYLCFRFDKDLHCPPVAVLQYDLPVEINSSLQWSAGWGANSNCFMDEHGWVMDRL